MKCARMIKSIFKLFWLTSYNNHKILVKLVKYYLQLNRQTKNGVYIFWRFWNGSKPVFGFSLTWDNNLPVLRLKHDFNHRNVEQGPILPVYKTNHIKGVSELTQIPAEKTRLLLYNYWFENEYVSFIYAACVIITVKEIKKEKDVHECAHNNYDSILPHLVDLEYTRITCFTIHDITWCMYSCLCCIGIIIIHDGINQVTITPKMGVKR